MIRFFIDLYFEYYHTNHCFLLPKATLLRHIYLKTDAALLHSMFSISCRFADSDPKKCEELGISAYHKDPMYWLSLFHKHRAALYPTILIKSLLLVSMTYALSNNHDESLKISQEASQLCRSHNLDKRFRSSAESIDSSSEAALRALDRQELMFIESHLRTVWEIWKLQVQIALISHDPNLIPPFNGDLGLPVSDAVYENEFNGWDFKRRLWRDLDADLLTTFNEAEQSQSVTVRQDISLEDLENSMYCGTSMYIVCANLLALVFKHYKDNSEPMMRMLKIRLKVLYTKLPSTDVSGLRAGAYLMAHGCLHTATLLLHSQRAKPLTVYMIDHMVSPQKIPVTVRDSATLCELMKSEKSYDACESYLMCQWAAHWLCSFLMGHNMYMYQSNMDALAVQWRQYSPLTGFVLQQVIPVLGTELVLQKICHSLAIPLGHNPLDFLDYPTFSNELGSPGDTRKVMVLDNVLKQPVGWYGNMEQVTAKLSALVALETFMGKMWPKIDQYRGMSEFIRNHATGYSQV